MISSSEINNHQICLINNNKIQYLHANRQADTNKQTGSNFTKKKHSKIPCNTDQFRDITRIKQFLNNDETKLT